MEPFSRGLNREFVLAEMKSWNLIPFPVRGILSFVPLFPPKAK
jgi:hypothetical protein